MFGNVPEFTVYLCLCPHMHIKEPLSRPRTTLLVLFYIHRRNEESISLLVHISYFRLSGFCLIVFVLESLIISISDGTVQLRLMDCGHVLKQTPIFKYIGVLLIYGMAFVSRRQLNIYIFIICCCFCCCCCCCCCCYCCCCCLYLLSSSSSSSPSSSPSSLCSVSSLLSSLSLLLLLLLLLF